MKNRQIFREQALVYYAQAKERDVLPHFLAPPFFLFLWLLLAFSIIGGFAFGMIRVPQSIQGTSIILNSTHAEPNVNADALLILDVQWKGRIQVGQHVLIHAQSHTLQGFIGEVLPASMAVQTILERNLSSTFMERSLIERLLQQPSLLATIHLVPAVIPKEEFGLVCHTTISIGDRSLIETL